MRHLFTIVALLVAWRATAQRSVSFDEALGVMLENNRALSGARYGVDVAEDELRAARGLRYPQVDLVGGYALMQRDVDVDLGAALSSLLSFDLRYTLQKRSFGVVGATLTVPIYMGGQIGVANRAAEIKRDQSHLELTATENGLLTELVERYYGVVLAQAVVDLRHEVLGGVDNHLYDAEAMAQEGLLPHSTILYLKYRRSEAERDLEEAHSRLAVAKLALRTTMGVDEEVTPAGKMFVCDNIYDVDYYIDAANNLNPILRKAEADKELAREGVKLSRAGLLPEVVAMGGASIYSYDLSDMVPRWVVGIGVKMPLFDGLAKERKYRAARLNKQRVSELVENGRSEIVLLVEKEYYAVMTAVADIESSRRSCEFADSYLQSTYDGFREGVVSSADLIDARVEYAAARVEYLNASYDFILSLARLLEASGLSSEFVFYRDAGSDIDM